MLMTVVAPLPLELAPSNETGGPPLAEATLDLAWSFVNWSVGMQELTGLSPDKGCGTPVNSIFVPLVPSQFPSLEELQASTTWSGTVAVTNANATKRVPELVNVRFGASGDGKTIDCWVEALPPRTAPNDDSLALRTHIDQQRFELLVDHMPAFIYTASHELVFTSSVGKGLAELGLKPGQVVGMSLLEECAIYKPEPPSTCADFFLHADDIA